MSNNPTTLAPTSALAGAARTVTTRPETTNDEVAQLRAQLAAANAEKEAAQARAAAAEAARLVPGRITAQVKSTVKGDGGVEKESKGGIQIYGVNNKFPVTVYLQSLVRMVKAMKEDGIIHKAVEANLAHVSIKLPGRADPVRATTPEAEAEVRRALAELDALLGR